MTAADPIILTLPRGQEQLLLRAAYVMLIYAGGRRTRDPEFRALAAALATLKQTLAAVGAEQEAAPSPATAG